MTRQSSWQLLLGVGLSAVVAAPCPAHDRPNIVVLFADDMGFSDVGCYGSEISTPNIDRLAAGGLRYSHFYNTGRCCPSRASILTGLYPHQADIGHMVSDLAVPGYRDRLSRNAVTLAEVLGAAGYHTIMTGKWHLGWQDEGSPTARGFEHSYGTRGYIDSYYSIVPRTEVYLGEQLVLPVGQRPVNHLKPDAEWYTTDVFTDYALHFIDEVRRQDAAPFFLYLAYNAPHFPLHAKPEDIDKYRGQYREGWQQSRVRRHARLQELGVLNESAPLSPLDGPDWETLSEQQRDDLDFKMALFAAIVDRLDQNIGRVIRHLEQIGELENTLIVFVSDNGGTKETGLLGIRGEENTVANYVDWAKAGGWTSSYGQGWANLSNTPFRRYKRENHEGGISAPCIFHWPAEIKSAGEIRHQPAHLIDLMPTFLEVAAATYPSEFHGQPITPTEGRSLVATFDSTEITPRTLYWEHEGNRAIRDGDWKLVGLRNEAWELYQIATDRAELTDLAESHAPKRDELQGRWQAWADRVGVLSVEAFQRRNEEVRLERAAKKRQTKPVQQQRTSQAPKPLFVDPHYRGSCDPEIVWNPVQQEMFIYYTARRATRETGTYVGTPIGVISSPDLANWTIRGYCAFDGQKGQPDNADTHWAPGILVTGDELHMFATYKASAEPPWGGDGVIRHYVASLDDPGDGWQLAGVPEFNQPDPIDLSLLRVGDEYRAYYRVGKGGGIQWATSRDMLHWQNHGQCPGDVNAGNRGFGYQEALYVFVFADHYWMLTDPHDGLAVFTSPNAIRWTQQQRILRKAGAGPADGTLARHPSVAVFADRAFIFYHTEPNRPYPSPPAEQRTSQQKLSFLQMAELKVINGTLVCERDQAVQLRLPSLSPRVPD